MPDVTIPIAVVDRSGLNLVDEKTAASAGNSYLISNDGATRLHLLAAAGATVTVATTYTVDGLALADLTVAVPAGEPLLVGPFPPAIYGTTLTVTVSANTDIVAFRG